MEEPFNSRWSVRWNHVYTFLLFMENWISLGRAWQPRKRIRAYHRWSNVSFRYLRITLNLGQSLISLVKTDLLNKDIHSRFPLEMQMVHVEDRFISPEGKVLWHEAQNARHGIAIIVILFCIDPKKPQVRFKISNGHKHTPIKFIL